MSLGLLHSATRDLHHAVEATMFGTAMAKGNVSAEAWIIWLKALTDIHSVIDQWAPSCLKRYEDAHLDYQEMVADGYHACHIQSPHIYLSTVKTEIDGLGAVYVLGGAHVMGGAIIQKQIANRLPCGHLLFAKADRANAVQAIKELRNREDLIDSSRNCFSALIQTAQEIENLVSVTV